jgi:hypothetical protein
MTVTVTGGALLPGTVDLAALDEVAPGASGAVTRVEAAVLCGVPLLVVEIRDVGWELVNAYPGLCGLDVAKVLRTTDGRELQHTGYRITGERDEDGEPVARVRLVFTGQAA